MKKNIFLLLFFLVISSCSSCNRAEKRMQSYTKELNVLKKRPAATSVAGAERSYSEVVNLAKKITREKEPPQQLLDGAFKLQRQRATEWKAVAIKQRAFGSAWKVFRALQESGAPVFDFKEDWNWGLGDEKPQSSAPSGSLKNVDPAKDTPASEIDSQKKGGR